MSSRTPSGEAQAVGAQPGMQRFAVLGSALAARPLQVDAGDSGAPAWTDGAVVHLDPAVDHITQVRALAVQASLLAAGSLAPDLLDRLRRRRNAARRYLAVEGHRALVANEAVLPRSVLAIIDRQVAGSVRSARASVELALGRQALGPAPECFGEIRVRSTLDAVERAAGATGEVGGRPPAAGDLDAFDEDAAEDGAGDLGQVLASPVGGGGPIGRLLARLLEPSRGRGGGGQPGADAATLLGHSRPRGTRTVASSQRPAGDASDPPEHRSEGWTYPEWDVHHRRYRPEWCTVVESDPRPGDHAPFVLPDGTAFRQPLARLGTGLVGCRRRPQGDEIDLDAAVEALVEARAGSAVDEMVYVESLRRRRDLAVQLLLDTSGSVDEPGPAGRTVHEHQLSVAASLTSALESLGDRVALHSFSSRGRGAVHVTRLKSFDDPFDGRVAVRLGGLVPGAYTRMGAAIRHGTTIVDERGGTSRRLLVVLSDGFAYDHGYEGRYGEADARRALAEARRSGVGCLCLSVGAGTDADALRRVFGTSAHATVATPDQLVALIGPLFHAALRSAESRRRVSQRQERTRERLAVEGSFA